MRLDFVDIKKKKYESNSSLNRLYGTTDLDFELKNVEYKIEYFVELCITTYGIDGMFPCVKKVTLNCDIEVYADNATNENLQILKDAGFLEIEKDKYENVGKVFESTENFTILEDIVKKREISIDFVDLLVEKDKSIWFEIY